MLAHADQWKSGQRSANGAGWKKTRKAIIWGFVMHAAGLYLINSRERWIRWSCQSIEFKGCCGGRNGRRIFFAFREMREHLRGTSRNCLAQMVVVLRVINQWKPDILRKIIFFLSYWFWICPQWAVTVLQGGWPGVITRNNIGNICKNV